MCSSHYGRWWRSGDPEPRPRRGRVIPDIATRFWSRVDFSTPNGCWPWTGAFRHDYGEVLVDSEKEYAHRIAFLIVYGFLPDAVCHHCDNPPCCRPDHLFGGTQVDNLRDMWEKGRGSQPPVKRPGGGIAPSMDHAAYLREWRRQRKAAAAPPLS